MVRAAISGRENCRMAGAVCFKLPLTVRPGNRVFCSFRVMLHCFVVRVGASEPINEIVSRQVKMSPPSLPLPVPFLALSSRS
jgi:hypothetical protein